MADSHKNQHPDWDIEKGDYQPNPHSTNTYMKKVQRNHILRRVIGIVVYAVITGILVYLILI
jgi:hypothetical protein